MLIATGTPDAPRSATLFARVPLAMSDLDARRTFEQPLGAWLVEQGMEFSLRCFPLPASQDDAVLLAMAVEKISELGAPPETLIEIESDKATVEMSLGDMAGM
jgi:hypothetical protein